MSRFIILSLLIVFLIIFEWYGLEGLETVFDESYTLSIGYFIIDAIVIAIFYKSFINFRSTAGKVRSSLTNFLFGLGFAIVITKIVFVGFLLLQDLGRILIEMFSIISSLITEQQSEYPPRSYLFTLISIVLSSIPFISMLYGISCGKYNYKVENITLKFPDLPKSFDGFKIIQISDIHAGSFDSVEKVKLGIDKIVDQNADLIVFTGDLVNSMKEEIDPYIDVFAQLSAPFGMYSILGNHDYYGMYQVAKKDELARKIYMDDFRNKHEKIGFSLLNNTSVLIKKNEESIRLIGVENWGSGPFPKKGDLNSALEGVEPKEFSILLSHDPTHWDHHVLIHNKHIHLTLSGHTHGMQFGINFGKFKWSPVKYRYKKWMGLYEEANQFLYVNRGFGFLAWPGRVGMSPEITLIELKT